MTSPSEADRPTTPRPDEQPPRRITADDVPPNGLWDERDLPPTRRRDALREG